MAGGYLRKGDPRSKLFSFASGAVLVYDLPKGLGVDELRIEPVGGRGHVLTDGSEFQMDLSERLPRGEATSQAA